MHLRWTVLLAIAIAIASTNALGDGVGVGDGDGDGAGEERAFGEFGGFVESAEAIPATTLVDNHFADTNALVHAVQSNQFDAYENAAKQHMRNSEESFSFWNPYTYLRMKFSDQELVEAIEQMHFHQQNHQAYLLGTWIKADKKTVGEVKESFGEEWAEDYATAITDYQNLIPSIETMSEAEKANEIADLQRLLDN